jgi:hypothetical protein
VLCLIKVNLINFWVVQRSSAAVTAGFVVAVMLERLEILFSAKGRK